MARKLFNIINSKFLGKHLEFRVRLFNLLAIAGIAVSSILGFLTPLAGGNIIIVLIDFAAAVAAAGILYYSMRTQNYVRCYYITIIAIFLCLFPYLFFAMGGFKGGMPLLFIFGIVFTAFMLEKKQAYITIAVELIVYSALFVISYICPSTVTSLPDEFSYFSSVLMDFSIVALALALMALGHFAMYNRQQRELEKAREDALVASETKSRFLANMSHEIRTPINIMLGMNEVILRESDSERIRSYTRNIENAGHTLMTLIDNVLDLSMIEKGLVDIEDNQYETSRLIASLSLIGKEYTKKRNLDFTVSADENLPRILHGNETHILQIVSNFLSNSAKYTERGVIVMSLISNPVDDHENEVMLRISVTDTGIGIRKESIPFLFDAFTRVDMSQHPSIAGSGLGLAIAKEFAERMGGYIEVESELGKGSSFSLVVPQKVIDKSPIGVWERDIPFDSNVSGGNSFTAPGLSILIVDDSFENILTLKALLSRTLMLIDSAASGIECLEAVGKMRYDVILMDYMMPDIDGIETLCRLKKHNDFNTPVIALTANVIAGVREEIADAGFFRYLSKPVIWVDLESALLDALPPDGISLRGVNATSNLPADSKDALAHDLLLQGVIMDDGLMYANGDIALYAKSMAIFTDAYETALNTIKMLSDQKNWEGLKLQVHSLKSNARNLGANGLSETSAKLEHLCADGNGELISTGLPLLLLEWERVVKGFVVFLDIWSGVSEVSPIHNDALPTQDDTHSIPGETSTNPDDASMTRGEVYSTPTTISQSATDFDILSDFLKAHKYDNAMGIIDNLINICDDPIKADKLKEIRQITNELEFRAADSLLAALIEGGYDS